LVLLLMIDAELDQAKRLFAQVGQRALKRLVDMEAIAANLVQRRAAQHPAPRSGVARTLGLVIAVEQESVSLVEGGVAEHTVAQDEALEEPARVGQVPLGGRSVGEG